MTDTNTDKTAALPAQYAIVELFGHAKVAGRISEQTFGGDAFVRVDVPEIEVTEYDWSGESRGEKRRTIQAHTRSFGAKAIYAISWCDEATAAIAARSIKHEPLQPYSVKKAIDSLPDEQRHRLLSSKHGAQGEFLSDDEH